MEILVLAALLLASGAEPGDRTSPNARVISEETRDNSPVLPPRGPDIYAGLGFCKGVDGFINLREVMFLENISLDRPGPGGPWRIKLHRDKVHIRSLAPTSDGGMAVHEINYKLDEDGKIDVELKLGLLDDRLVVYWRQTFLHHSYRQGLFAVVGEDLKTLCEGRGGADVSH